MLHAATVGQHKWKLMLIKGSETSWLALELSYCAAPSTSRPFIGCTLLYSTNKGVHRQEALVVKDGMQLYLDNDL